jgi:phosphate transport system substrate-binding protein
VIPYRLSFCGFLLVISSSLFGQSRLMEMSLGAQYQRLNGISGTLSSAGSDTLANLMTLWAEDFNREYPNVIIQIQAAGSSTAPPALVEQTASLGPMSRRMKEIELQAFESRYGYPPTAIPVALDALAVYVHKDNPLQGLTIAELDAIFSSTRRCGQTKALETWADLGLPKPWGQHKIRMFGRNSVSGTYGFFKQIALCNGDFRNSVGEQPGSGSVVQAISGSLNGVGYSGIGYRTSSVRAVPIALDKNSPYIDANAVNAMSGDYPLARFLLIYINRRPNQELPPLEREFIRFVLSRTGQESVLKDGYIPLPSLVIDSTLESLDIQ